MTDELTSVRLKDPADAGRLYLAFQTPHTQMQLKALASGSVVDATFPADAEAVVLPPLPASGGPEVERCWEQFSEAEPDSTPKMAYTYLP